MLPSKYCSYKLLVLFLGNEIIFNKFLSFSLPK